MATVGSLVVDLIANTASFVAGMRTARTEVTSTAQAMRAAQGQLGSATVSAAGAAEAIGAMRDASQGIAAAGQGAKELSNGLDAAANSAGRVAEQVATVKSAMEGLKNIKLSAGALGQFAAIAAAVAFWVDLIAGQEEAANNAAAARTGLAPDNDLNRESSRIEAETNAKRERQRKSAEFLMSGPFQSLQSQAMDIKALQMSPERAAEMRMRESLKVMGLEGKASLEVRQGMVLAAGEMAGREEELKRLAKDRAEAESVIKGLKEQSVTAGRTEVDSMEDQLRLRKLDGAQLQQALQLSRQIRGQNLAFSLGGQDPQTAFAREMQSIMDAVKFGGLSKDLANDGIAAATLRLAQSATQTARAPAGLVFGSNQAFTAEGNKQQLSIDLVKQQLGIAQKQLTVQEAIAKGQAAVQAVGVFKIK